MDKASTRCPSCSAESPAGASYCPKCGEPVSAVSQLPTNMASPSVDAAARRRIASSAPVGRLSSSDSIHAGGFAPGEILAERYRIIGLLGRGGMGEVYRADDLKLGQPVALKFLPRRFASDKDRLDRFYAEVRIARTVSHPNVCRVYDVGEIDGQQYLSMEYVDGEDLASLLKRIGRLPPDKALEISRELCAGLAAAHDRGVLHRDLKPSNVMVDGRGRARITDFGLAVAADAQPDGEVSGTPAYMAPEQLAGKGASTRSDVYALGLVLYELSTGKKAFDGATLAELRRKHAEDPPASPSAISPGFDPVVERVILRCLEKDPAARPASAAQVAKALPGGDPLAAALAAGETPSPEMVAAAGSAEKMKPSIAHGLLAGTVAMMLAVALLVPGVCVLPLIGSEKSPEVLRARAREILVSLGIPERPADWAQSVDFELGFLYWVAEHDPSRDRWKRGLFRDAATYFYRDSPLPLAPYQIVPGPNPTAQVTREDPPPLRSGMREIDLDLDGRLKELHVVPVQLEKSASPAPAPDWGPLFRAAGLDPGLFHAVEPRWTPQEFADTRAAWEGPHPERPGLTMRVEAAAFQGRPVSFRWIGPWTQPLRDVPDQRSAGFRTADMVWTLIVLTLFFGGAWMARRNVRAGRVDKRGASRLGATLFILILAMWVSGGHHVASLEGELRVFVIGLANAVLVAGTFWLVYLAIEPFARRHWPEMLVTWTRLIAGGWRDPMVGRDLLVGAAAGSLITLLGGPLRRLIPVWLGQPPPPPRGFFDISSAPKTIAWLLSSPGVAITWVFALLMFLVLVRRLVRRQWIAAVIVTALFTVMYLGLPNPEVALPLGALSTAGLVVIAIRFGALAALVCEATRRALDTFVLTPDPSAWYFYPGALAIAGVLAVAIWGYVTTKAPVSAPAEI